MWLQTLSREMLIRASAASAIHSPSTKWSTAQVEQRAPLEFPSGM